LALGAPVPTAEQVLRGNQVRDLIVLRRPRAEDAPHAVSQARLQLAVLLQRVGHGLGLLPEFVAPRAAGARRIHQQRDDKALVGFRTLGFALLLALLFAFAGLGF